jgi:DNA-binding response OmpR family regulator
VSKNLSILCIEDHAPFLEELKKILTDFFNEVVIAKDGAEGLAKYKSYKELYDKNFDIVLTDISLPKMTGITLSKEIRTLNQNQPIIVLSAYTETDTLVECINMGIHRFIKKPLDYDELFTALYNASITYAQKEDKAVNLKHQIALSNDYIWDNEKYELHHNNRLVPCTKHELFLINLLIQYRGTKCDTEHIVSSFYAQNTDLTSNSIRNLVLKIRKKTHTDFIKNIYGLGYCIDS